MDEKARKSMRDDLLTELARRDEMQDRRVGDLLLIADTITDIAIDVCNKKLDEIQSQTLIHELVRRDIATHIFDFTDTEAEMNIRNTDGTKVKFDLSGASEVFIIK